MILYFKIVGWVIGGVMFVASVAMLTQAYILKTEYSLVEAHITSVEIDCFIKQNRDRVVDKTTKKTAYMDCARAPAVAAQYGIVGEQFIHKRAAVEYQYTSPADGNIYHGSYTRKKDVDGLVDGKKISVHAHDRIPGDSRTTYSNFFMADSGV